MNRNYRNRDNSIPCFMVRHEGEKGDYWKGYVDLGGGKGLRLVMFPSMKEGMKSEFTIKCYKKSYNARKKTQSW